MRTIIFYLYFFFYVIFIFPFLPYASYLKKKGRHDKYSDLVENIVRNWAKLLLWAAGAKVKVEGLENIPDRTAVFVSNHQSNFDIPLLLSSLDKPHGMLAKIEMKKIPGVAAWMKEFGCVFIDRDNPRESIKALNEAGEKLEEGISIIVFPEGTRSKCEKIGDFKSGAFKMAFKNNVPIVPVALNGTYKLFEANGNCVRPASVSLKVFPSIETAGMDKARQKVLGDEIKEMIENYIKQEA